MAREIKFRAWSESLKTMFFHSQDHLEVFHFNDKGNISLSIENDKGSHSYMETVDDAEFMQFTTVTDKNDKEIYEGDIVKVTSHSPSFCQFGLDKDCEGIVDFLECGFVVTDRKTFARPLFTEIWMLK